MHFPSSSKKKYKNHCFSKVLATLAVIFLPFRTREYIVKHSRIGPGGPLWPVKYSIFSKIHKKMWKSHFLRWLFSLPFSVPFWDRFSFFFRVPKFPIFFSFFKKKRLRRNPPKCIFLYFLASALRNPQMSQKGPQNAPKMVPKQSPKGLEKFHFRKSK